MIYGVFLNYGVLEFLGMPVAALIFQGQYVLFGSLGVAIGVEDIIYKQVLYFCFW